MLGIPHVTLEREDLALLNSAHAGDQREQRRFAGAVRSDQAGHAVAGYAECHIVERDRPAVSRWRRLDWPS